MNVKPVIAPAESGQAESCARTRAGGLSRREEAPTLVWPSSELRFNCHCPVISTCGCSARRSAPSSRLDLKLRWISRAAVSLVLPMIALDLPRFGGHPRRGALREAMLENLPQENLATWLSTWLSQVDAWVSFQGIWEMIPNSTACHPCARILVSPM